MNDEIENGAKQMQSKSEIQNTVVIASRFQNQNSKECDDISVVYESRKVLKRKRSYAKLCQENEQRSPAFSLLPEEIWRHIFKFLQLFEMPAMRRVSKQLKMVADESIARGVVSLEFYGKFHSHRQFKFWCSLFTRINSVVFKPTNVAFLTMLAFCKDSFACLAQVTIDYEIYKNTGYAITNNKFLFDGKKVDSFCECFPSITKLCLKYVALNDKQLEKLFEELPQLEEVIINSLPISGRCFSSIGNSVNSLTWYCGDDCKRAGVVHFGGKATRFDYLEISVRKIAYFNIANFITHETPNLSGLKICMGTLADFSQFRLQNLERLWLSLSTLSSYPPFFYKFSQPMQSLKFAEFNIESFAEQPFLDLLSNFPCLETLTMQSKSFRLSSRTAESFRKFRHCLKHVEFFDHEYYDHKYTIENESHALFGALAELVNLSTLVITFNYSPYVALPNNCERVVKGVDELAIKRTEHSYLIHLRGMFCMVAQKASNVIMLLDPPIDYRASTIHITMDNSCSQAPYTYDKNKCVIVI